MEYGSGSEVSENLPPSSPLNCKKRRPSGARLVTHWGWSPQSNKFQPRKVEFDYELMTTPTKECPGQFAGCLSPQQPASLFQQQFKSKWIGVSLVLIC